MSQNKDNLSGIIEKLSVEFEIPEEEIIITTLKKIKEMKENGEDFKKNDD